MNTFEIRLLQNSDVEDYRSIRLSALKTAPEAFGSVHGVEAVKPINKFAQRLQSSLVFGAYEGTRIVGMIGFRQEDGLKDAHKGCIWGFYVEPCSRIGGVGTALLRALVRAAHEIVEQVTLTVVSNNTDAVSLYERFGFTRYGVEPRALKNLEGYSDEVLMVLFLDERPQSMSALEQR